MPIESKRIFINDLPETLTKDELETNFKKYGEVSSIEIKERKKLGPTNKSLFFAYVNLITDDKGINKCFQELSNIKWHGNYIQLQIAKESFLERLKREREENLTHNNRKTVSDVIVNPEVKVFTPNDTSLGKTQQSAKICLKDFPLKKIKKYKYSSESDSESSESESNSHNDSKITKSKNKNPVDTIVKNSESVPEDDLEIIIKNNRNKIVDKAGLKIPSVGKEPIITMTKIKPKSNDSEANIKRLQSLRNMKKNYSDQKTLIKKSLSYGSNRPNNKIVFDDGDGEDITSKPKQNGVQKINLFEDKSDDDTGSEVNFEVKEQFLGESGQKLLELQTKYKNDKRFALDKRFIEDNNEDNYEQMETEDSSVKTIEAEKKAELKILEEVLGKKLSSSKDQNKNDSVKKKTMLRFDPSKPDHINLEVTVNELEEKKKKNKKLKKTEVQEDINPEPEVSKEVFYKVKDNLKETFEEKQQFSLLSMFGKIESKDMEQDGTEKEINTNSLLKNSNPFKYDSSDDENETEDIPHKSESEQKSTNKVERQTTRASPAVFWTEPFFFTPDDYRLQEGFDFLEKIKSENKEFSKIRRDLKGIVKAKVRNNERKNKMFKKKLGGSKRRKHIRIKKALKR